MRPRRTPPVHCHMIWAGAPSSVSVGPGTTVRGGASLAFPGDFHYCSPMDVGHVAFSFFGHLKSRLRRAERTGPRRDASSHLVYHTICWFIGAPGTSTMTASGPVRAARHTRSPFSPVLNASIYVLCVVRRRLVWPTYCPGPGDVYLPPEKELSNLEPPCEEVGAFSSGRLTGVRRGDFIRAWAWRGLLQTRS